MDYNQPNAPFPIGFTVFDAVSGVQRSGSWGVDEITPIGGGAYMVALARELGGVPITDDQVYDLHIVPSVKEIFTGYTITAAPGTGFVIDFGAPMVNPISIAIGKLVRSA